MIRSGLYNIERTSRSYKYIQEIIDAHYPKNIFPKRAGSQIRHLITSNPGVVTVNLVTLSYR